MELTKEEFDEALARAEKEGYLKVVPDPDRPDNPRIYVMDKLKEQSEDWQRQVLEALIMIPDAGSKGVTIDDIVEYTGLDPIIVESVIENLEKLNALNRR